MSSEGELKAKGGNFVETFWLPQFGDNAFVVINNGEALARYKSMDGTGFVAEYPKREPVKDRKTGKIARDKEGVVQFQQVIGRKRFRVTAPRIEAQTAQTTVNGIHFIVKGKDSVRGIKVEAISSKPMEVNFYPYQADSKALLRKVLAQP